MALTLCELSTVMSVMAIIITFFKECVVPYNNDKMLGDIAKNAKIVAEAAKTATDAAKTATDAANTVVDAAKTIADAGNTAKTAKNAV
ncbi:hypothetical protein ACRALDRAFT_1059949, partial [Sodiomyces alcalophilus JCM 7366]|uniref:uncharacterized protein n=1 Tax=Sodiomyces alcalophilus JCM 7366 TaxID=591952 RepID=UPI0039B5931F